MFTVKTSTNNIAREVVFYDVNKAISYFEDVKTFHLVHHARLFSHRRVIAEF